jgi:mono/diheme cytochrome c family protein
MSIVITRVSFSLVLMTTAILSGGAAAAELPAGPNRPLVFAHCQTCHSLDYLTDSRGLNRSQWDSVIDSMQRLGLPKMSEEDHDKLLDYLATYLGPKKAPTATAAVDTAAAAGKPSAGAAPAAPEANGAALFEEHCAICHQETGEGVPMQFPPLAGNRDLFKSHDFPVLVILHGLQGKIEVRGNTFNSDMPGFDFLSNEEIAALVGYIRSAWGNEQLRPAGLYPLDADAVKQMRLSKKTPYDVK